MLPSSLITSCACSGMHLQWCILGILGVLGLFKHHTPLLKQPSWEWSVPACIPAAVDHGGLPLQLDPPGGSLCTISYWFDGPLLSQVHFPQLSQDSAQWPACKAPTSHLYRLTADGPALSCTAPSAPGTWHTCALVSHQCVPPRARKFPLTTC